MSESEEEEIEQSADEIEDIQSENPSTEGVQTDTDNNVE
jgi:hypothetical protein